MIGQLLRLAMILMLVAVAGPLHAQSQPAVLSVDSPAWHALMNRPMPSDGTPPVYIADLIQRWGLPQEAEQLLRMTLLQHHRRAAGMPDQAGRSVAGLWQLSRSMPAETAALADAHGQAFSRGVAIEVLQHLPPGRGGSGLAPLAAAPGFWLDGASLTLGAHLALRNQSPLVLAAQDLTLHVADVGPALPLRCSPTGPHAVILPGQTQNWWCVHPAPTAATLQVLRAGQGPRLQSGTGRWTSNDLADPRVLREIADILGARPPADLAEFVQRHGSCEQLGSCPRRIRAQDPAELQARAAREAERKERRAAKERRDRLARALGPWVYGLVVITVHVLAARLFGRWAGVAWTLASGVLLAAWLVIELRGSGSLAGLILPLVALGTGVILAPIADWLYRRFFAGL